MVATHASKACMISLSFLRIPDNYNTTPRKVDDEVLLNSVRLTGIQQPLIVVEVAGDDYWVVDGIRRFKVAHTLEMESVPCVIDHGIEDVDDETEYRNRIRFILDEHRQDLLPSQRAGLIKKLQQMYGLKAKQVGDYLGVTPGTITNWTLIEKMIPEIQKAIDDDVIRVHTARAFAGLTPDAQREIWEEHKDAILGMSGARLHGWVREKYSPSERRDMYNKPEVVEKQLNRNNSTRKGRSRSTVSAAEKKSLLTDVEAKRIELEDKQAQLNEFDEHINAAVPVIEAIRSNKELWEAVPEAIRADFEEFAERYLL